MFPPALNRRHKAGLFLVLVAVGIGLLLDATAKQTAGVVVLGIAAAWGFGSLSLRMLGFLSCSLICAAGIGLVTAPLWLDWDSYRASVQDYDSAVSQVREAFARAVVWDDVTPNRIVWDDETRKRKGVKSSERDVEIPESVRKWLRPQYRPDKWEQYAEPSTERDERGNLSLFAPVRAWDVKGNPVQFAVPGDASDKEFMEFIQSNVLLPKPTFSIRGAISSHRTRSLIAVTLLTAGLLGDGLLIGRLLKSRREARASPA